MNPSSFRHHYHDDLALGFLFWSFTAENDTARERPHTLRPVKQTYIKVNERDQVVRIEIVADIANRWRDPDHEARADAVRKTLSGETTYTEEALAFVVNQTMHQLTEANISGWLKERRSSDPKVVGIINVGASFFLEIQDFLAVLLTGHQYYGVLGPDSPCLLQAFASEIQSRLDGVSLEFGTVSGLMGKADALIASPGQEEIASIEAAYGERGIQPENRLLRGPGFAVAVLDGGESPADFENLAEDMLLHDGRDRRNVAIVWAPQGMTPDPLLDAMADFRGVFPAHPNLPGALKMQQAFMDALKVPNAYGEGMEFLLSKGEPEVQMPGHIRWTEYDELDVISTWIVERRPQVELIVGRPSITERINSDVPLSDFGYAQRPPLAWKPAGVDTIEFLTHL